MMNENPEDRYSRKRKMEEREIDNKLRCWARNRAKMLKSIAESKDLALESESNTDYQKIKKKQKVSETTSVSISNSNIQVVDLASDSEDEVEIEIIHVTSDPRKSVKNTCSDKSRRNIHDVSHSEPRDNVNTDTTNATLFSRKRVIDSSSEESRQNIHEVSRLEPEKKVKTDTAKVTLVPQKNDKNIDNRKQHRNIHGVSFLKPRDKVKADTSHATSVSRKCVINSSSDESGQNIHEVSRLEPVDKVKTDTTKETLVLQNIVKNTDSVKPRQKIHDVSLLKPRDNVKTDTIPARTVSHKYVKNTSSKESHQNIHDANRLETEDKVKSDTIKVTLVPRKNVENSDSEKSRQYIHDVSRLEPENKVKTDTTKVTLVPQNNVKNTDSDKPCQDIHDVSLLKPRDKVKTNATKVTLISQNNVREICSQELRQYVGDISDLNFDEMEMDNVFDIPSVVNSSKSVHSHHQTEKTKSRSCSKINLQNTTSSNPQIEKNTDSDSRNKTPSKLSSRDTTSNNPQIQNKNDLVLKSNQSSKLRLRNTDSNSPQIKMKNDSELKIEKKNDVVSKNYSSSKISSQNTTSNNNNNSSSSSNKSNIENIEHSESRKNSSSKFKLEEKNDLMLKNNPSSKINSRNTASSKSQIEKKKVSESTNTEPVQFWKTFDVENNDTSAKTAATSVNTFAKTTSPNNKPPPTSTSASSKSIPSHDKPPPPISTSSNACAQAVVSKIKHHSMLPMSVNSAGERVFRFFWWDAFEDFYTDPGVLYLFGKFFVASSNEYISCCVVVRNIPRRIYVLPRKHESGELTTLDNAYAELNEYMRKNNVPEFKCKKLPKMYAFEKKDIPQKATYLEVRYSASYPAIDPNYSGPAIQAVFGTSVNALELFLIEKNVKGPCWMDVKVSAPSPIFSSWCKIEINCARMEDISVTRNKHKTSSIPPVVTATLSMQMSLNEKLQRNDIVNVGILIHHKFHLDKEPPIPLFEQSYCLITRPQSTSWAKDSTSILSKNKQTKVTFCDTEFELLERLLEILRLTDPDILIGYDVKFEFDILARKLCTPKVKNWSRIGKLKRVNPPNFKGKIYLNQILCGRPLCDVQTSMNEFHTKMMNSDLASLCSVVLNDKSEYKEIRPEDCSQYYSSANELDNLVKSTMSKASYMLKISVELNILPLAMQITNIVGNTLSRTLSAGVGERNEFLLLHAFQAKNYLTPDRRREKSDMYDGKKKAAYAGGVILEPKAGFYDTLVLLLDFNSLYPSIIQEYNICFTTIPGAAHASVDNLARSGIRVEPGILPAEICRLVESRVQLKKMMDSPHLTPELRRQYNIRQLALKLTANSMYGCLGATYSRFYAKGLAALVTQRGREIFQSTKDLVESYNYEVLYGDTDSLMINTKLPDYEPVLAIGRELRYKINKLYKKVKIDVDRIFRYLLLLKKKQYAGVTVVKQPGGELEFVKEVKGLEIIRRDCCAIASDTGNQVLDELLKDQPADVRLKNIFEILETVSKNLREMKVPLSSLEITKQLSKDPNKYTTNNQSHIIVAQRLNRTSARKWKAGDAISYIICQDGTERKPAERAYHIQELEKCSKYNIDVNYYLMYQIFPILLKICDPIEGIEDMSIAHYLGIENFYKPKHINPNQDGRVPFALRDDRYKSCIPFKFNCRGCKTENEINSAIVKSDNYSRLSLAMCSNPKCNTPPWKYSYSIQNKLQLDIRKFIAKYYRGEMECDNPLCCNIRRRVSLDTTTNYVKCCDCFEGNLHKTYREVDLYNQLSFFLHIFTLDQTDYESIEPLLSKEVIGVYNSLKEFMIDEIENNAYCIIDLDKLFCSNVQKSDVNALNNVENVMPCIDIEDNN